MGKIDRTFTGKLDLDTDPYRVEHTDYIDALNVTTDAQNLGQDLVLSNVNGNQQVSYTLPSGTNKVIGFYPDKVRNRGYYFVYNSNGNHSILYYNAILDTVVKVLESKTDSNSIDILSFNPSYKVLSVNIFYRDDEGDILFFNDGINEPRNINVSANYGSNWKAEYLSVAKAPPIMPPKVVYENESGNTTSTTTVLNVAKTNNTPLFFSGSPDYVAFTSFSATSFTSNFNKTEFTYTGSTGLVNISVALGLSYNQTGIITGSIILNGTPITLSIQQYYSGFTTSGTYNKSVDVSLTSGDKIRVQFTSTTSLVYPTTFFVIASGTLIGTQSSTTANPKITINNLRNSLFQFSYRYVYNNNEKSVWGAKSIVPLPNQPSLTLTDNTYTNNSRISCSFSTGDTDVKSIELSFRQTKDGVTSNWYLIKSFSKSDLSLSNNDIYTYNFYNDSVYSALDVNDTVQLQDYVPQVANAGELANGNTPLYAGITEGYNLFQPTISVNQITAATYFLDYNGTLFFATINGTDSGSQGTTLKLYLYGTGTNTAGAVTTLNNGAAYYKVNVIDGSGTQIGTSYLNTTDNPTVSSILTAVSAALVTNGFTQVSLSGNVLTMSYPTTITLLSSGTSTTGTGFESPTNAVGTIFQYAPKSSFKLGTMYFDSKGRTNGVITSVDGAFSNVSLDGSTIAHPQLQINHRPPLWATNYSVVRSTDLTYGKRLDWVTNGAYSDESANILGVKYAYLEIDNIEQYNKTINATTNVVSYGFEKGDRVRIFGRYDGTGTAAPLIAVYDYEIIGTETSVIYNGITKYGNFIKIYYPTSDIDSYLKFDGSSNFLAYQILLYNYAQHSTPENQVYFEFGKKFGIGNSGTVNAYHIGQEQTQTSDLLTPALIGVANGDYFARNRVVPIGQTYTFTATGFGNGFVYISPVLTITGGAVTSALYTVHDTAVQQSNTLSPGDYDSAKAFFINLSSTKSLTVRVRCKIPVMVEHNTATGVLLQAINSDGTYSLVTAVVPFYNVPATAYNLEVDKIIIVKPLAKLHLIVQNTQQIINQNVVGFDLIVDVINNVTIPIVENGFSDVYQISTNSNGRPAVVDINAKSTYFPTLIRFGGAYQTGTNLNATNRFVYENFDEYDRSFGDVIRLHVRDRYLKVYQRFKVGNVPILTQIVKDVTGNPLQANSDQLINKIQYYAGEFGIGDAGSSLAWNNFADYFIDDYRGVVCRLSQDGITPLSINAKTNAFFVPKLNNFRKELNNTSSNGYPTLYGVFDAYTNKYIIAAEQITRTGFSQDAFTISFSEDKKSFESFHSYHPEMMGVLNTLLMTFSGGNIWKHNAATYCNYYGVQYPCYITVVFNDMPSFKKTFVSLIETGATKWVAPIIYTNLNSYGSTKQSSNLIAQDFSRLEDTYNAPFRRDVNSLGGLINGDVLKGEYIVVRLQVNETEAAALVSLNSASVKILESNLNIR